MKTMQKGFSILLAVLIVAIMALAGVGAYIYVTRVIRPIPPPVNQEPIQSAKVGHSNPQTQDMTANPTPAFQSADSKNQQNRVDISAWPDYSDGITGVEFKVPPFFQNLGYQIQKAQPVAAAGYDFCKYISFDMKPTAANVAVDKNKYQQLFSLWICPKTDYCNKVGKNYCDAMIKKQGETGDGAVVFNNYVADNGQSIAFVAGGPSSKDAWDYYGWDANTYQAQIDQMLSTFKFVAPQVDKCDDFFKQPTGQNNTVDLPVSCKLAIGNNFNNWRFNIISGQTSADLPDARFQFEIQDENGKIIQKIPVGGKDYSSNAYEITSTSGDDINFANDINFDGYKDLRVLKFLAASNTIYDYWFFNPDSKRYEKNPVLTDIPNASFDGNKKEINSYSAVGPDPSNWTTFTYQFINGKYKKIEK